MDGFAMGLRRSSRGRFAHAVLAMSLVIGSASALVQAGAQAASRDDANRRLIRSTNAKAQIYARLPSRLSAQNKKLAQVYITRSLAAARAGDGKTAVANINLVKALMRDNETGDSPWESCGKMCRDLLNKGNAPGYAVCYWACVIRGGPDNISTTKTR